MKNVIINFSVLIALLASCSPATKKNEDKVSLTTDKVDTLNTLKSGANDRTKLDVPNDFSALTPIDLLNSKSADVYEKYGIEFSGNCYACDLASLSITNDKMIWTNVCDDKDTFEINDFSFDIDENKAIFKTTERTYVLTKIDQAPVYELIIEGKKLELDNKRVSRYFTTKEALPLFKEHDCGEFEG